MLIAHCLLLEHFANCLMLDHTAYGLVHVASSWGILLMHILSMWNKDWQLLHLPAFECPCILTMFKLFHCVQSTSYSNVQFCSLALINVLKHCFLVAAKAH